MLSIFTTCGHLWARVYPANV